VNACLPRQPAAMTTEPTTKKIHKQKWLLQKRTKNHPEVQFRCILHHPVRNEQKIKRSYFTTSDIHTGLQQKLWSIINYFWVLKRASCTLIPVPLSWIIISLSPPSRTVNWMFVALASKLDNKAPFHSLLTHSLQATTAMWHIQGVPEKTAESLRHQIFATACHRVVWSGNKMSGNKLLTRQRPTSECSS